MPGAVDGPPAPAARLECAMRPHAVRLFGRPELDLDGRHRYLAASQVDQCLAYLALRADWVTRDELIFLFWSDRVDAVGRRNLRKLLHRVRRPRPRTMSGEDGLLLGSRAAAVSVLSGA
jgi:DNA-binding SARP family transcriptional activator